MKLQRWHIRRARCATPPSVSHRFLSVGVLHILQEWNGRFRPTRTVSPACVIDVCVCPAFSFRLLSVLLAAKQPEAELIQRREQRTSRKSRWYETLAFSSVLLMYPTTMDDSGHLLQEARQQCHCVSALPHRPQSLLVPAQWLFHYSTRLLVMEILLTCTHHVFCSFAMR